MLKFGLLILLINLQYGFGQVNDCAEEIETCDGRIELVFENEIIKR